MEKSANNSGKIGGFGKTLLSKYGIVLALIGIVIMFSLLSDKFFSLNNGLNILRQVSIKGIISIGMCFVILTGGVDLSVGSVTALSGIIIASLLKLEYPIFFCILCGVLAGMVCGLGNGFFVAKRKMPPFIVTMAMLTITGGLSYIISDAKPISNLPPEFLEIGKGSFLGIPIPVWILAVVFIIALFVLERTVIGRHIYAVGGNEKTALVSGINTDRVKLFTYTVSGTLCGVAAAVLTARISSALSSAAEGYELDAIAAVVIGGVSMTGGKGRLWGVLIGILLIGVINNGMDIVGVSSYYQKIVMGVIILAAIQIDLLSNKD